MHLPRPSSGEAAEGCRQLIVIEYRLHAFRELVETHEGAEITELPAYVNGGEELLIGAPYGEDVYYYYLQAMIAAENGETQRYNKRMTMFNAAYQEWTDFYNRTHKPKRAGAHFLF